MVKRIASRLQAQETDDLSERARRRAEQLANDADLRTTAPKATPDDGPAGITTKAAVLPAFERDPRVPRPGSILTRRKPPSPGTRRRPTWNHHAGKCSSETTMPREFKKGLTVVEAEEDV